MERFDWLEVDKAKPKPAPEAPGEQFDARHYFALADKAYRRGDYEFALKHFGKALREKPDFGEAWLGQVLCLVELGELEEAKVWASKALDSFPESPELLAAKGLVLARLGERADAIALSDRAIAKKQASPRVWLLRGLVFLCLDPDGRREGCFLKAQEEGSRDGYPELRIGMGYLDQGNVPAAKPFLLRAVELDSENALAWNKLGECFEKLFSRGRAKSCYERAVALQPENRVEICESIGRLERAGLGVTLKEWWRGLWGAREE